VELDRHISTVSPASALLPIALRGTEADAVPSDVVESPGVQLQRDFERPGVSIDAVFELDAEGNVAESVMPSADA
jgi:hypothetical protein